MSAFGLPARMAARRLRQDRRRSAIAVGLVATAVATLVAVGDPDRAGVLGPPALAVAGMVIVAGVAGDDEGRRRAGVLLHVNGARPRQVRLGLLAEGLLLGALGTAVGLAAGAGVQVVLVQGSRGLSPDRLAGTAALGIGTTVAAALVASLRARVRPAARPSARAVRWPALVPAAVAIALGTAIASASTTWAEMALLVPVGGALVAVGASAVAAVCLALLGPPAAAASGALRLAASGVVRSRRASAAVVSLVVVVGGVAVVGATMGRSFELREERRQAALADDPRPPRLWPDQVLVSSALFAPEPLSPAAVAAVRAVLPAGTVEAGLTLLEDAEARFPDEVEYAAGPAGVALGDAAVLAALGLDPALAGVLEQGRAVALNPALVADGEVSVGGGVGIGRLPAVAAAPRRAAYRLPGLLVPPSVAEDGGSRTDAVLFRAPQPVDGLAGPLLAAVPPPAVVELGREALGGQPSGFGVALFGGDPAEFGGGRLDDAPLAPRDEASVRGLVLGALVAGAAVVVLALGLATVDRRVDDELLVVLGAPPGLRRRVGALQAGLVSAVAGWVSVAVGLGATAAAFARYNARSELAPIPFVVPWDAAVGLALALPLVAAVLTGLLTRPLRRVDLAALPD